MRAVIQRVKQASVSVAEETLGEINQGFVVLLGIHETDQADDVAYLVRKISKLRVFEDESGKMNQDLAAVAGSILSISQFTLYADTKKGNRPSFVKAARPEVAIPLYEAFNEQLRALGIPVATGEFGADMAVSLINDGPVTIIIDTLDKEKKSALFSKEQAFFVTLGRKFKKAWCLCVFKVSRVFCKAVPTRRSLDDRNHESNRLFQTGNDRPTAENLLFQCRFSPGSFFELSATDYDNDDALSSSGQIIAGSLSKRSTGAVLYPPAQSEDSQTSLAVSTLFYSSRML